METLTYRRFLSTADAGWAAAYRLYEASFPPCERRSERDYDAALADGRLYAESVWDGDLFVGLVFWWLADEGYAYLEHLAVEPVLRGHNYGARILYDLCRRAGRVILEIDPPEDEISRRRRGFYERNGFTVTNMITHEADQTYRVLARDGIVSPYRLEEALNSVTDDPAYASRVTTD